MKVVPASNTRMTGHTALLLTKVITREKMTLLRYQNVANGQSESSISESRLVIPCKLLVHSPMW